jgi:heme exporter protein D
MRRPYGDAPRPRYVLAVSSQVPLWLPVAVALLGLAGVLVTQLLNNRREELRWRRDREARSHDARATAYAEVMGVIEAFDMVLFENRNAREEHQPINPDDLKEAAGEARRALGPVNLHAPEAVRVLLSKAVLPRMHLARRILDDANDPATLRPVWDTAQVNYRVLRAEMRRDLGLDAEDLAEL